MALALTASAAGAADPQDLPRHEKVVVDFYENAINQEDFQPAAKHFGPAARSRACASRGTP